MNETVYRIKGKNKLEIQFPAGSDLISFLTNKPLNLVPTPESDYPEFGEQIMVRHKRRVSPATRAKISDALKKAHARRREQTTTR